MNAKKTLLAAAVVAVILGSCGAVLADNGQVGPYYHGYYAWALPPSIYVNDYIPYYAAHPPVYYSYPVPRPYGFSPYAYPPGTMTPEPKAEAPVTIQNEFFRPGDVHKPAKDQTAAAPRQIVNPYVLTGADAPVKGMVFPVASAK